MCLEILEEPQDHQTVEHLQKGTWFTDSGGQIHVIVHDDRCGENRIVCVGGSYDPFIADIPLDTIKVEKVLKRGTVLKITRAVMEGGLL